MGDCDRATQYARQRSFPVTAFDLVTMVSLRDLQPLFDVITVDGLYSIGTQFCSINCFQEPCLFGWSRVLTTFPGYLHWMR